MKKSTNTMRIVLLGAAFLITGTAMGQVSTRSNQAAKTSEINTDLPCSGSVLFTEDFEAGIPVTWTVIDGDTLTPRSEMGLQKGWQSIVDYRDTLDHAAASPSWYINSGGQSDDWLISPAITVGSNSCLSWNAYSQDAFFEEAYEVRVATTVDTATFLANPVLRTIAEEAGAPHFSSASLSAYAGQTVHIAFRQTSDDKFVLVLDDVTVSNVNTLDIGVKAVTYGAPDPGDTVTIRFEVANYGSDTVTSFEAWYALTGGIPQLKSISAVSLPPNKTVTFSHDSVFVSDSLDAFYPVCTWTKQPNNALDQDVSNDTLCLSIAVGNPVGAQDPHFSVAGVDVFPNPFGSAFTIQSPHWSKMEHAVARVYDLNGQLVHEQSGEVGGGQVIHVQVNVLPSGVYLLVLETRSGARIVRKLMHL